MSDITVSIDGGIQLPAEGVVIFHKGVPIAAIKRHGHTAIYVDAAREPKELRSILDSMGYSHTLQHKLIGKVEGSLAL